MVTGSIGEPVRKTMPRARAETSNVLGSPDGHSHSSSPISTDSTFLVGLSVVVYALLCAFLLSRNVEAGAAAALAPAAVLLVFQKSTTATSRQAKLAWLLLVVAACPWQTLAVTSYGQVSTGSEADAAKFLVTALAFGLAFLARVPRKYPSPVSLLLAYALVAALGGLASTDPSSSVLRAIRFAVVVIALFWVTGRLTRYQLATLFLQFSVAVSFIALAGHLAGISAPGQEGRLAGYLPPLQPNVLGIVAAAGCLCAVALLAQRKLQLSLFTAAIAILGLTLILTQSRTSLVALIVSLLVLGGPRLNSRATIIVGLITLIVVVGAFLQTNTHYRPLTALSTHNGNTTTTHSLGSRLSEWEAVFQINDSPLTQAIGQGLATKSVEVNLSSARYAPVDGSWPAAYLSAGFIGALILAASVLTAAREAIRSRNNLALMALVFLVISSLTTDVFNDISVGLILFLSIGIGDASPVTIAPRSTVAMARPIR